MQFYANDPILKNDHFAYELTREEIIEKQYQKIARMYSINPEEFTYKNVFHYVMLVGTVSFIEIYIVVLASNSSTSCHV